MDDWVMLEAYAIRAFGTVVILLGVLLALYLPGLLLWQLATWMDVGTWVPVPAILAFADHARLQTSALMSADAATQKTFSVLTYIPEWHWPWLERSPTRWAEVQKAVIWALERTHIGVLSAAVGVLVMAAGAGVRGTQQDKIRMARQRREYE